MSSCFSPETHVMCRCAPLLIVAPFFWSFECAMPAPLWDLVNILNYGQPFCYFPPSNFGSSYPSLIFITGITALNSVKTCPTEEAQKF